MIRGKPKSPEKIVEHMVKRTHYYHKKFPEMPYGDSTISYSGRQKLMVEFVKRSIYDKTISDILVHGIKYDINKVLVARKISKYALQKYGGKDTVSAMQYLKEIVTYIDGQKKFYAPAIDRLMSDKRQRSKINKSELIHDLSHRSKTNHAVLRAIIDCAILAIKSGEVQGHA